MRGVAKIVMITTRESILVQGMYYNMRKTIESVNEKNK